MSALPLAAPHLRARPPHDVIERCEIKLKERDVAAGHVAELEGRCATRTPALPPAQLLHRPHARARRQAVDHHDSEGHRVGLLLREGGVGVVHVKYGPQDGDLSPGQQRSSAPAPVATAGGIRTVRAT